jgi:hypothetical protein
VACKATGEFEASSHYYLSLTRMQFRKDMGGDGAKHDVIKSLLLGLPLHDEAKDRSSGKTPL